MVSTRGIKSKFTEGELVLCYEPDPAKTKVLYDSKVLEISVNKDENGKKFLEFLIHFQGWNQTWDRFVTEDYVLKDTAENRQLQKELAEKAQLTTAVKFSRGGNLYKRDSKKRRRKLSEKINESLEAKRPVAPQVIETTPKTRSNDVHTTSSESSIEEDVLILPIPEGLKKSLELDYYMINRHNKTVKLPVKYNVLSILESYVKEYAIKELSTLSENEKPTRSSSSQSPKSIDAICNRLNLRKEVADGLRVYFDFTLRDLLLYHQEKEQYTRIIASIKLESHNSFNCESANDLPPALVKQEMDSPPMGSPQHPSNSSNNACTLPVLAPETSPPILHASSSGYNSAGGNKRRKSLRSHKPQVINHELTNGGVGRTYLLPNNFKESASSATSVSSLDTTVHNQTNADIPTVTPPRQEVLMTQIMSWKILPSQAEMANDQVLPSQVYGATHLARLFVKLPELLQPSGMAEDKLEILLQRLNEFMGYLESHKEWFGESHYVTSLNGSDYGEHNYDHVTRRFDW